MTSDPEIIEAEAVEEQTAAVVPFQPQTIATVASTGESSSSLAVDPYIGVAAVPFDDRAQTVLAKYQTVPDEWIDIKPNGQIYLSHMRLRSIYNEAFGFGGWGLVPVGDFHVERVPQKSKYPGKPDYEHVTVYREFRLYVQGRFVRQMMGAGDYYTNNPESNYADAVEAAESYALNRSGKPFGIAAQCWDKGYGEWWKSNFAFQSEGKWKKRYGQPSSNSGAGDSNASSSHPQQQSRAAAPPPSPSPASDSAPLRALLRLVEEGKNWTYGGEKVAMFKDDAGKGWKFVGETIGFARAAVKNDVILAVEYFLEPWEKDGKRGKNKVVTNAQRAEVSDAE
jgi:hypothetical protein